MRVQVDDLPRMESISTSSAASSPATSACLLFHLSRPASAALFVGRIRHHHQRHLRPRLLRDGLRDRPCARRGNPRRFALHLAKVRRPGRVAEARGLVFCRELEQFFERTWRGVDVRVRIADLRETLGNREDGKVGRLAVGDLVPVKRRGHTGVGQRAHGIRGARRPIFRVLVVVEEHAVTLLFPPLRAGQSGRAPLDFTRQRERRAAHLAEGPARMDPHVDVHSRVSRWF